MTEPRVADSPFTHSLFIERWSPRSFTDEPVTADELAALFEAARWAPSWKNNQPWIYLYATEEPDRSAFLNVFMEFNQEWARHAPVLGLVLAKPGELGPFVRTAGFDTGAATMAMALQATMLGLSVHLLGGIELDAAYELTGADPESVQVLCGLVIGRRGDGQNLSDKYRAREAPGPRKPVSEFAFATTRLPAPAG